MNDDSHPGCLRRRFRKDQSGQALIEIGITMVLFLVLVFGLFEAGRLIFSYSVVSSAAREAVRYAIVRGSKSDHVATETEIGDVARDVAIGLTPLDVTVSWTPDNQPGGVVRVDVAYDYHPVVVLFPLPQIRLASTSRMIISR